jgi:hypothetical protein
VGNTHPVTKPDRRVDLEVTGTRQGEQQQIMFHNLNRPAANRVFHFGNN